jgi:3-hydroxyacyl-CoA dehydrogenase
MRGEGFDYEWRGMSVGTQQVARIRVVTLDNPPVNAISVGAGVVSELAAQIEKAMADPEVDGVVLAGAGKMFSGGADIGDFDTHRDRIGDVRVVFGLIERSAKPVVAALHGMALGGGLELAMGAHYRIARKGTRVGLPEINLGLLPGGGGTQRLPRLLGVGPALDIMLSGKPVPVETLPEGLIDQIVDGDPVAAAIEFLTSASRAPRPTSALSVAMDQAAIDAARAKLKPGALNEGGREIIACVETAASGDPEAGLAFEAERFDYLLATSGSAGLRQAFFAERKTGRVPNLDPATPLSPLDTAAVIGAGLMGTGIATAMLAAGIQVVLVDTTSEALDRATQRIAGTFGRDVKRGRLSREAADARLAALTTATDMASVAQADLIVEAVFESMDAKRSVFEQLDKLAKPGAILASNTSTLDVDVIAGFTQRPEAVIGLHFFSPANIMRLLEIVRGARTSDAVLATSLALAKRIGKVGVVVGVCDGFVGNRMFEEYCRQAQFLAEEGATPQQVDAALEQWGMAMGPFRTLDLAGQDVSYSVRSRRVAERPQEPYSTFLDKVYQLGRYGQKVGKGVNLYADLRTAQVDPEMDRLLLAHSEAEGITRSVIAPDEMVDRCILALVNEGAKILEEGMASRASDIDVIYLTGYGFPAERGGPMFYADTLGLPEVLRRMARFAQGDQAWAWKPAPLLVKLAAEGSRFEDFTA